MQQSSIKSQLSETGKSNGMIKSLNEKDYYVIGLIDILTYFNMVKKGEFVGRRMLVQGPGISSVPPSAYQKRFIKFMESIFN